MAPKNCAALRLRAIRIAHQTRLVVNPPASTTHSTGNPCASGSVPAFSARSRIGCPASSPQAKHPDITPENTAISRPLTTLNSLLSPRSPISRALACPARATTTMPISVTTMPARVSCPLVLPAIAPIVPWKIGGPNVPITVVSPSATAMPSDSPR